ncbi:alpha/beta fold hydrolase [Gloeocapsa sp. PCC 73106]|uniref:alpha/beta fold hydrolase n=1 Tax=Gloeocapsa sp. PCC 73106 TaxID=102232 RepID=UPI0002AD110A|nr:alpha/beta fold hydrolase [Gloeocapsa sp. PCC 73106]ELR99532.1 putative hydrolase or acyltransferase of alpha/beta superfamily [Gloeocapsa sp. PCC 73106]
METLSLNQSTPGSYWQWQGHSLYYVQRGKSKQGRPPLLLIHGFGASTDHWRKNIAELEQDFAVWTIDLLGFGRSAKPAVTYSGNLWRDQIYSFITEVIQEPVVLAGNSLGGYTSLYVAAQHPDAAKGLILINTAGPFTQPQAATKPNLLKLSLGNLARWIFLQPWGSYLLFQYLRQPAMIRKTLKKVYWDQSAVTEQLVADIHRPSGDRGAAGVFASVFKNPQGEKNDVLLQQLRCPLLMLWGEKDPWMDSQSRGTKFREYYPTLTEYYLEAGHCPHDEIPEQINSLIRSWVNSITK